MKRLFPIIAVIFVIGSLLYVVNYFINSQPIMQSEEEMVTDLGLIVTTQTANTVGKTTVRNKRGELTKVRDFTQDQDVSPWYGDTNTLLIGSASNEEGAKYQVFYFKPDSSITISLLAEPFASLREVAVDQLIKRLSLSNAALCELDIRVTVPAFASEELSGKNLGLPGCPGAIEL
jgi:hypothetical protein